MSDDSNNGGSGRLNAQQDIDSMVASDAYRSASGRGEPVRVQSDHGNVSVTVGDGDPRHEVHRAPRAGSNERLHDSGVNIPAEAQKLASHIAGLEARLNEVSHYDEKTGKPVLRLPHGSKERADTQAALDQRKKSAQYQIQVWQRLQAQRDADAEEERKQAALKNYIGNDPQRAAAVKQKLIDREADELVNSLFGPKKPA